jgi:HlyD family secretion protein
MSATVEIETETEYGILTVPIQAVTTRADTTGRLKTAREKREEKKVAENEEIEIVKDEIQEYVFLYQDGKAILSKVKTGIQDNTYIQITEGVNEGDEVITAPYRAVSKTLRNRDEVEKVDKDELFKGND